VVLGHSYFDFYDLTIPKSEADIPLQVKKYLTTESARRGSILPYLKHCYIPVTHLLEYTSDWDQSSFLLPGQAIDKTEYGEDLDISSLSRFSGERDYI